MMKTHLTNISIKFWEFTTAGDQLLSVLLEMFAKFIKNKNWDIACVFTPFTMTLKMEFRHFLFPLIILEMFLQFDWSPAVVNSIDWPWFGKAHTCLHKIPLLSRNHEVKGIVCRPLRQDYIEAQIWRRVQKHFCSIEDPEEHSGLHHW